MKSNIELIQLLQSVLETEYPNREKLIKEFQDEVWDDTSIQDEMLNDILTDIAYDLDFYEPNEEWRKEDPSYYGDDRLEEVVQTAIQKLQEQSPI